MELSEYLRVLARSWITVASFTLAGLAVAAGALLVQPVTYSATAETYVSISSARDVSTASQGSGFAKALAADLATLASTPYVLDRVREDLKLSTPTSQLRNQIGAAVASDGAVVQVTATTAQSRLSAALANAVVVELSAAAERLNPNSGNAVSIARTTTVGRAAVPTSPSAPAIPLNLVVGALGGFALGVLVVLVRQVLDQRLRTAEQIGRLTGAPTVGPIRLTSAITGAFGSRQGSADLHHVRRLRSEVMQAVVGDRLLVAVSGVAPGRSAVQAASALGASFASTGLSTLVVDADERGDVSRSLYGEVTQGLDDVLAHPHLFDEALVHGQVSNLWHLPGTAHVGRAEDLLNSSSMRSLLETAAGRFAAIVVNVRSVGDVPLPSPIATAAQGAILICEVDGDDANALRRALASLGRGRVRVLATLAILPWSPPAKSAGSPDTVPTALIRA